MIGFCFDEEECKYITVNNYGACWKMKIKKYQKIEKKCKKYQR